MTPEALDMPAPAVRAGDQDSLGYPAMNLHSMENVMAVTTDKLSTVPKNGDAASLSPSWSGVRASSHGTGFSSGSSFGSITADRSGRGSCCCDCVPLSRGPRGGIDERKAGAPETFRGGFPSEAAGGGRGGFRPRHRRGWSTGSITPGVMVPPRTINTAQPRGWEDSSTVAGSTATSTTSSNASAALATAAAAAGLGGGDEGAGGGRAAVTMMAPGGRRSGSWGGVGGMDREFHRILKAGIDVYKHSTMEESGQWGDVVPRRIKEFLSRRCPLEDSSEGLVTLFLNKERDFVCWCLPGAAELVPDENYRLRLDRLIEVAPGGHELHQRFLSLRASDRPNPLVFELDSDELYNVLSQGLLRILERNHIRDTLMTDSPITPAL